MFGALAKTYYAEKAGIDPKDIVSVSIMPCVAKKFECDRPEMYDSGYKDVDYVLTTREAAGMMKEAGIDLPNLEDGEYRRSVRASPPARRSSSATPAVLWRRRCEPPTR